MKASCLGNFHQVSVASHLYLGDYDETFMPVNHQPGQAPNAQTDRTWVQVLLPYVNDFKAFKCPSDNVNSVETDATFDQDLLPGDLFARYYVASMHVNVGYNFQYLAPVLLEANQWVSEPKSESSLADPSNMLMFVDSVWEVKKGEPTGGGSYLVAPPCRYQTIAGTSIDTIAAVAATNGNTDGAQQIFAPSIGWEPFSEAGSVYGGAWPWHIGGLATLASVDGSARPVSMSQLGAGCVIRPAWKGNIVNRAQYIWSPE